MNGLVAPVERDAELGVAPLEANEGPEPIGSAVDDEVEGSFFFGEDELAASRAAWSAADNDDVFVRALAASSAA
jgi:hypothetical protein